MENNYCNKCGECCRNIVIDSKKGVLYRDGIEPLTSQFEDMLIKREIRGNVTICECKYLDGNLCTNVNKPVECLIYPSSAFAFLQENCGYEGDIFAKHEQMKQKIRKKKEEILDCEMKIQINPKEERALRRVIEHNRAFIEKFSIYGSADW